MNITHRQKEILLEWMKLHPDVAKGRIRRKGQSKQEMKELLEDLSKTINSAMEGPIKTSSEWLKTWKDWKMNTLKKETKRRNHCLGTGGGSPIKISFSSLEEELLEFITPEAAGLEHIPQGGIYIQENVDFISKETDRYNLLQVQDIESDENENIPPSKRLCKDIMSSNNSKELNTTSMSAKIIDIQKEKLILKKEELDIQRQLLDVQKSMLIELQQIRSIMDTFGSLE